MQPPLWPQLLLQVILIAINAYFAATEIAVISLNEAVIRHQAEEGDKKAARLLHIVEQPTGFLSTIQIGITLAGFLGSAFAADNLAGRLSQWFAAQYALTAAAEAAVHTHLLGGSSGREGAILQIGGSLSSKIGRWMRLDDKDSRIITMCGMSAAFSALFGTPLTAAMFAMEVTSVGVLYYAAIVPCVLSAIIGLWVAQLCGVPPTAFSLQGVPNLTPVTLLQCIGMGVLFALLSILFCRMMHAAPRLYDKYLPNPVARAAAGGALVIALTFLVWLWNPGTYDYNGAGTAVIHAAIGGEARPEAFLLKMLFTTITLGAGFKGGEIVPVFFTGATFGCTAAPLLGLHSSFGAGLGMVCVFCGVTNCPMTSLLLSLELFAGNSLGMFTGQSLGLFAVCIAVAYMLSGYYGLYSEQKIVYSKLRPEYIDKKANDDE